MLDQPLERFPGEIEPVEIGVAALQRGDDPQGLRIVVEAAIGPEHFVERPFADMAERRVAEVMRQRERFGEILVEPERTRERARNLLHFQGMRQPGAVMVALVEHEDLGLVLQAAEGSGMDDAVAIPAEIVAARARRLGDEPAPAQEPGRRQRARAGRLGWP